MDTKYQRIVSPVDLGGKDVFVINDIDLVIPPSQIEVNKQNLTFRYRTLRSKVATKVPTGHGQSSMHVGIPFTADTLLSMHRLVVEVKNNPFVYVDNRFVRETFVPDWPFSQAMAFTVTGLNVTNMPNTSDAFMLDMDMTWFNYFPYMHNYLFREDWQTNWIRSDEGGEARLQSLTIGWRLNQATHMREYFPNVLEEISEAQAGPQVTQDKWSVLQGRFTNTRAKRTIYEMEQMHPGVEWDLLPMPGNMQPSRIVGQPRYSRIYVRYMNMLQRDALLKNFGIDVEADVRAWEGRNQKGLYDALFRVGLSIDDSPTVIPLHSNYVPRELREAWVRKMMSFNFGVRFHYNAYKEIRLPQKWTDNLENKKNQVIADLFHRTNAVKNYEEIQRGSPDGQEVTIPVLGAPFPITSPFGPRIHPRTKLHQDHEGIDIGAPRGTRIRPPEHGTVSRVVYNDPGAGNYVVVNGDSGVWKFFHMDQITVDENQEVFPKDMLGTVGNTGATTRIRPDGSIDNSRGYHLHLEFWPHGSTVPEDPEARLRDIYYGTASDPSVFNDSYYDYSQVLNPEPTEDERLLQLSKEEAARKLELTEEESAALQELIDVLAAEGWSTYDADVTVTNVWKKLFTLEISHSGRARVLENAEFPEEFRQKGIVMTNIVGSLSHIVARIPVLSHEFPTQQHLGSVEPEYALEFAVLDDMLDLDGISSMAQMVEGMRSVLQSNSRKFRQVIDGWCCACDTFITRLLGSYVGGLEGPSQASDFMILTEGGYINDIQVKKRCIISDSHATTVPGSPGLSVLTMNLQETNPYEQEKLVSTAPTRQDKEAARQKVLDAVYNLRVDPKYRDLLLPIFIAQRLKTNLEVEDNTFGKFAVQHLSYRDATTHMADVFLYTDEYDRSNLMVRSKSPNDIEFFRSMGLEPDYYYNNHLREQVIRLNPAALDGWLVQDQKPVYVGGPGAPIPALPMARDLEPIPKGPAYKTTLYDISQLARENIALSEIPVDLLMDYYVGIEAIIQSANRMFAEKEVGGLEVGYIRSQLYDLPVRTDMWKSWQMYLEEWAKVQYSVSPSAAIQEMHGNDNWPTPGKRPWAEPLSDKVARPLFTAMQSDGFGIYKTHTAGLTDLSPDPINALWTAGKLGYSGLSSTYDLAGLWRDKHNTAIQRLVNRYMLNFPFQIWMPERLKQQYQSLIGNLIGNFSEDERGKVPALDSMHSALFKNAYSCGNITFDFMRLRNDNPIWQNETPGAERSGRAIRGGIYGAAGFVPTVLDYTPIGLAYKLGTGYTRVALTNPVNQTFGTNIKVGSSLSEQWGNVADQYTELLESAGFEGAKDYLYPYQTIGNTLGTPFEYPTDEGTEQVKVRYIKGLLAAFADTILGDYELLECLGLTHLMFMDESRDYSGMECYPDLDLPAHPYYGSTMMTTPDFYMWNIYEDGGALGPDQLGVVYEQVNSVLDNCYDSMKRMEAGEKYDERRDTIIPEVGVDDPITITTQLTPEGTDSARDGTGAMACPFYPTKGTADDVEWWSGKFSASGVPARVYSSKPSDWMEGIRLSNAEGLFGYGGGGHYPKRAAYGQYLHLKEQFYQTKQLFGSSEGYLNRSLNEQNTPEIATSIQGTNLERPPEAGVFFDKESLKQLARDSAKDLISQKMSLKRAFPTFKLYFIEEDEFETRFLNFDDFYSYNAVKSISVVMSRKMSADHAVVQVQNIGGTLDGTKRNAIVDLDYFSTDAGRKLESHNDNDSGLFSNDPVATSTASDQPFGAVVLRPGLNVQLRVGFSNDPNNLHVMLSGRVVDVTWNKTGDLAEIMIQSFGTELEQVIKGTARDEQVRTFYTTHELLGSMMLEPEVVHFGRWEFGQLFQIDEAKDHKLDFTEYSREGFMGRFTVTSWLSQWIMDHPWLTLGVMAGGTALNMLPFGRPLRALTATGLRGTSAVAKVGNRAGLTAIGTGGYRSMFAAAEEAAEGLPLPALAAARAKALADAQEVITKQAAAAAAKMGSKEWNEVLETKIDEALKVLRDKDAGIDETAAAFGKLEAFIQGSISKSRWMARPWMEINTANFWTAFGFKPIGTLINLYFSLPLKAGTAAFVTAAVLDGIIEGILRPIYRYTIGGAKRFFARTNAQLFLTPQDDNLFPPHPKDYMTLDRGLASQVAQVGLNAAAMFVAKDNSFIPDLERFLFPDLILSKKVEVNACQYQLISTTIWKVFHEMSLRHPGWIYGARPYGNTFRYTMFFGLPAQRYWARPGTNAFITRANKLRRYLDNRTADFKEYGSLLTEREFAMLYGEDVLDEIKRQTSLSHLMPPPESVQPLPVEPYTPVAGQTLPSAPGPALPMESVDPVWELRQLEGSAIAMRGTAMAIAEYLRAVQIRFEPFRRYHLLTSERDIVWNGIMGSEQAVVNAVDVTYLASPTQRADDFSGQTKTAVFKAHAFIPEHKLRIAPVRWYNCKGYAMAMRYGMGELLDRMRDMYRGEIVLLGNPRIRPWDIGILVDTYNDMVGPIEVEQVVHTFSHETGFLTEIKPSAVVFANEISGWPMIEAMKLFALAVQDIHNRWVGVKADDSASGMGSMVGVTKTLANIPGNNALQALVGLGAYGLTGPVGGVVAASMAKSYGESIQNGAKYDSFIDEKYKKLFGGDGPQLSDMYGGNQPAPNLQAVDTLISDSMELLSNVSTGVGIMGASLSLTGGLVGTGIATSTAIDVMDFDQVMGLNKKVPFPYGSFNRALVKNPMFLAAGAAFLTGTIMSVVGGGAPLIMNQMDFPGLAWLMGGNVLFLQCLRNDAIIVVPLTKNGHPIVAGLAYNDPAMIWKSFRGQLNRMAEDTIRGTTDMISLYKRYGSALWERASDPKLGAWTDLQNLTFGTSAGASDESLTGER